MTAADLAVVNGRLRTMVPGQPVPGQPPASALAASGGVIVAVGRDDEIREWIGPRTRVVDLGGGTLTPGLVDGHTHPILGASSALGTDLSACRTLDDVRAALGNAEPVDGWVRAWGLDPNAFGDQPVIAAPLEGVLRGQAAFVHLFDGHAALASAEALRRAGVDGPRRFTSASAVVCEDGRPTGLLLEEDAITLVTDALPRESEATRRGRVEDIL
ncbi:MAG: amidohydrolase family protein, partial [Acidimicrobiales bacterium]